MTVINCLCVSGTFRWREHVGVKQSPLEAPAPLSRQVRQVVPVLGLVGSRGPGPSRGHDHSARGARVTVAGLTWGTDMLVTGLPDLLAVLEVVGVAIVTVCSTVYLEDDGAQRDQETDADASEKHQSCPLRLVCERKTMIQKHKHTSGFVFLFSLLTN